MSSVAAVKGVGLYVLAGGASRRFGRDKAAEVVDGQSLLSRVVDTFAGVCDEVALLVNTPGRYCLEQAREVVDSPSGIGPLGGLHAALMDREARHGGGWVFLTSCDLVHPKAEWLEMLLNAVKADAEVVAYRGDFWEATFALYHTRLLPRVQRQIDAGVYALQRLCDAADSLAVELPGGMRSLPQANTPEELQRLIGRG